MTAIINEWQLDTRLNVALQKNHQGDFSLFLALLSKAVEENAEFFTPDSLQTASSTKTVAQQLSVRVARPFGWQAQDQGLITSYGEALQRSGLAEQKLLSYLNPEPIVYEDNKLKLPSELWQSLDLHTKRRINTKQPIEKAKANPAALYEVLEKLHQPEAA
ncbi:VC2046/SO_2500 family protein [Rheinheimera sp. WS51]|uniref:VC2046/SO_2500 family protein n=1 Tax=Rheinheimera sp. WS51 TaxID=3425886 RepID=UPI003D8B311A